MRKVTLLLTTIFVMGYILPTLSQAYFSTSLHGLRGGKVHFYNKVENGGTGGFETLTNVPITGLGCVECHDANDANGVAYPSNYVPGCADCHATNTAGMPVTQADCLGCHSREASIINNASLSDVHRAKGFTCVSCHKKEELHGDDGVTYNSFLAPGAVAADCANSGCHPNYAHTNPAVDPHAGKLHCTSCHASTNLTCYSCHFESQVVGKKRAMKQITGFVFLVNRTKDNKVHPATYQSLTHQGNTWITFGPSVAHTIVKTGARTCTNCHQNFGGNIAAITDYNADGILKFATWNPADSTVSHTTGIIPMPSDWQKSLRMDYLVYNGAPSDPVVASKNWSLLDDVTDGSHMLYATPLTNSQMAKIGMDTAWVVVPVELTSFVGSVNGDAVKLSWSTATEVNNNGFEVQKKSGNGFSTIGFVKGNGTSTSKHEYSYTDKQLQPGTYTYRLKQMDFNGKFEYSQLVEVNVVQGLSYSLIQNYPNPFNPVTAIKYTIAQNGKVSVKVFSISGTEIATLVNQDMSAGSYEVKWNGKDNAGITVTSGVYFIRLSSGSFVETKKMMFLK